MVEEPEEREARNADPAVARNELLMGALQSLAGWRQATRPWNDETPVDSTGVFSHALGRLPWFAPFLRRARRLRPVLPMMGPPVSLVQQFSLSHQVAGT